MALQFRICRLLPGVADEARFAIGGFHLRAELRLQAVQVGLELRRLRGVRNWSDMA